MAPVPASSTFKSPSFLQWLRQRDASRISNPGFRLFRRQTQADPNIGVIIPTTYVGQTTDPSPGTVAGIVLGSILGFLLLVWLMMTALSSTTPAEMSEEVIEVRNRRSPSPRHSHRSSHRSDYRSDSIRGRPSRDYSPRRRTQIIEEKVVEERFPTMSDPRMSKVQGPLPPPPPPPPPDVRGEMIVKDQRPARRGREEEVVVIEDGTDGSSDILPKRGRRPRSSGYRPVDLGRYAGGDYPIRPVGR
jgi:hypothetical protein